MFGTVSLRVTRCSNGANKVKSSHGVRWMAREVLGRDGVVHLVSRREAAGLGNRDFQALQVKEASEIQESCGAYLGEACGSSSDDRPRESFLGGMSLTTRIRRPQRRRACGWLPRWELKLANSSSVLASRLNSLMRDARSCRGLVSSILANLSRHPSSHAYGRERLAQRRSTHAAALNPPVRTPSLVKKPKMVSRMSWLERTSGEAVFTGLEFLASEGELAATSGPCVCCCCCSFVSSPRSACRFLNPPSCYPSANY